MTETRYEKHIEKLHKPIMLEIEKYIENVFYEKIQPWLQKYHLKFVAGMGGYHISYTSKTPKWFIRKYKDTWVRDTSNTIDKDKIDQRIRDILESTHDALNGYPIGSWMPDYKETK